MSSTPKLELAQIAETLLDERSSIEQLELALDRFSSMCSAVTGITPDPSYQAWSDDSFLQYGVAINPQAAAFCIVDYPRTVMFIRGINAAIHALKQHFTTPPLHILYAGCGPFATLLLPLLGKFNTGDLHVHLIDIHQRSVDSVKQLIDYFELGDYRIKTLQADACSYQHSGPLQLIIAETMQKSLEQEPQFMVTANLAPQLCPQGIFIPERIEVELCLGELAREVADFRHNKSIDRVALQASGRRHSLASLLSLIPGRAQQQLQNAEGNTQGQLSIVQQQFQIPDLENLAELDVLIFTRIKVFGSYWLQDYESQISLPSPCNDLAPLRAGATFESRYELGAYPKFSFSETRGE